MKTKTALLASHLAILLLGLISARAQNTAFTYQGVLKAFDSPTSGLYDFKFRLFDAANAGNRVPNTTTEVSANAVPVSNGLFAVRLDFGSSAFDGSRRWLEMDVRTNNQSFNFVTLSPRTELTPTPYAIRSHSATTAMSVLDNALTATKIAPAQVVKSLNGLKDNVNLVAGANVTLTTSGNNLSVSASGSPFSLNGASAYYNGGSVGIGTSTPAGGLQVASGGLAVTGASSPYSGTRGVYLEHTGWGGVLGAFDYNSWTARNLMLNPSGGNVGVGTLTPQATLDVAGTAAANSLQLRGRGHMNDHDLNWRGTGNLDHGAGYRYWLGPHLIDGPFLYGWNAGALGTSGPDSAALIWNWVGDVWVSNNLSVATLTIRGGADFAEPFHVSSKDVPKGAVMVIDEENSGQLKLSDRAYDSRVAGIISGAGGVNPGITLQQEGVLEGGQNVALSGRVYVQADASEHPIKPGDLLTTSDMPGHAMKAADTTRATGAILGKAMTALENGRGLVLVLVSLQ